MHHDRDQGTVVLEYASAGRVVATGAPYGNRYISVFTLRDREIVHWRDYLDPVAVFDALGWPSRPMAASATTDGAADRIAGIREPRPGDPV